MTLIFLLFSLLVVLGVLEYRIHKKNLDKIKIRILVNGTRGKTSVTRIVWEALNEKGIKTSGRTTGSSAEELFPGLPSLKVERKRGPRITELLGFVRKAVRCGSEAVAVECMALAPENQKLFATHLLRPTHVIITNSYVDHIAEIGRSRADVIWALANSVPKGARLYTLESDYQGINADVRLVTVKHYDCEGAHIPIHDDNLSVAEACLSDFGIGREEMLRAVVNLVPDPGLHKDLVLPNGAVFRPEFSVNDYECMKREVARALEESSHVTVVFNNRSDREYRLPVLKKILGEYRNAIEKVFVLGDYGIKCERYLSMGGKVNCKRISIGDLKSAMEVSEEGNLYLALGNIKGDGEILINTFFEEVPV